MKKSEIAMQYEHRCTDMFIAASIALTTNAVLSLLINSVDNMPSAVTVISQLLAIAFTLFAYIITIKGFSVLDKACRLSEENENYYMGRNLKRLSIASFVLTLVMGFVAVMFNVMLSVYANNADSLTEADKTAAMNLSIITAVVLILEQIVVISTVYIIYFWKIHKYTTKSNSINNFALLTMIVMLVQLVIGILSTVYTFRGSNAFLNGFSSVLLIVKYILLLVFFILRRKSFTVKDEQVTESVDETVEENTVE